MVFYRTYRPQTIEELDSKEVRDTIQSVLSGKSVPHAFLFTGPKGLGKTSAARIVAKALNCEKKDKKNIEPCNECNQCISITNGSNMDVMEIDAASNRGIDEIRDLREKIRLAPLAAQKKVYIIDEVHMLTSEAFNALLKTLEEPPAHAFFILCTTESHKVPSTILSRCFRIQFSLATHEEMIRAFARILKRENIDLEKDALTYINRLAEGSFRDGVKILEEIALLAPDKKITKALVEEKYKISSIGTHIHNLLPLLKEKNIQESVQVIEEMVKVGIDAKYIGEEILNTFHMLLLAKAKVGTQPDSVDFSMEEIKELTQIFSQAYLQIKFAAIPHLPLELAVVEWGLKGKTQPSAEIITDQEKPASKFPKAASVVSSISRDTDKPSKEGEMWGKFIDAVKEHNHSLAGVLRGCHVKGYTDTDVSIETNYKFHKDRLNEPKTLEILATAWKEITGHSVNVSVLLKA
jgi:DNA polymerase-3 subunit gamma/tau